jgi:N-acetylglucosaminyldiphosphoundecaprenol N-acetyl-beta-D-mannosaminyltransferase
MSERVSTQVCKVLGINFFNGSTVESLNISKDGGLVVAPSGPGLASDLTNCSVYARALFEADLVLPDSGLMCLWQKWIKFDPVNRISGLKFLQTYLEDNSILNDSSYWVMPDQIQAKTNQLWLSQNMNLIVLENEIYIAPIYKKTGNIEDLVLLEKIREAKPKTIFIQVGGGVQERLGLFLKNNLKYRPTILCTGAALAFLSGEQVRIPQWADRFYFGWLLRCLCAPSVYIPRYLKAFRLLYLLKKYGSEFPA